MRKIVNVVAIGVLVVLAIILLTGCGQYVNPQSAAQRVANDYTEVCINGKVYYAWEGYGDDWTFAPKIVSGEVTVNC